MTKTKTKPIDNSENFKFKGFGATKIFCNAYDVLQQEDCSTVQVTITRKSYLWDKRSSHVGLLASLNFKALQRVEKHHVIIYHGIKSLRTNLVNLYA